MASKVVTGEGTNRRGSTGAEAVPVLRKIRARHVGFTVDILGEAVVSESLAAEAKVTDATQQS